MNFAVNKFHRADYRPHVEDTIVDYVQSLEFLLVPDASDGEISYKFRSRGTSVLGRADTPSRRREIYGGLKDAYKFRSAIVHGDRKEKTKMLRRRKLREYLKHLRCLTREAIKFYFRHGSLDDNQKRRELMERITIFNSALPN